MIACLSQLDTSWSRRRTSSRSRTVLPLRLRRRSLIRYHLKKNSAVCTSAVGFFKRSMRCASILETPLSILERPISSICYLVMNWFSLHNHHPFLTDRLRHFCYLETKRFPLHKHVIRSSTHTQLDSIMYTCPTISRATVTVHQFPKPERCGRLWGCNGSFMPSLAEPRPSPCFHPILSSITNPLFDFSKGLAFIAEYVVPP